MSLGAPTQHRQPSKKSKRSWRKNVDLRDIEERLENIRVEETIVGALLQDKPNNQVFSIDATGDAALGTKLRRARPLTSAAILAARSSLPAVTSKPVIIDSSSSKHKASKSEKDRLRRIAKRNRSGPLNTVIDPTRPGEGSALLEPSNAVIQSGKYDVWDKVDSDEELLGSLKSVEARDFLGSIIKKTRVKAPKFDSSLAQIGVGAISDPHQGTSYNPPVEAHQELLLAAHEVEVKREADAQKYSGIKEKMESARRVARAGEVDGAPGMIIDIPGEGSGEDVQSSSELAPITKKSLKPKTKQQKAKAKRLRAEKHLLAERSLRRKQAGMISSLKSLKRGVEANISIKEDAAQERRLAQQFRLRKGLAGSKIGKHVVPEGEIHVQLGEELSESLRGLKPEGNLLKDRYVSFQHRAMVEPRSRVTQKRRRLRLKEFERHSWKDFN